MALISKSAMVRSSLALVRSLHGAESAELALAQSTDNPEILAPSSEASRERLRTLVFRKCQAKKKRTLYTHIHRGGGKKQRGEGWKPSRCRLASLGFPDENDREKREAIYQNFRKNIRNGVELDAYFSNNKKDCTSSDRTVVPPLTHADPQ